MADLIDREELHEYLDGYYRDVEKNCETERSACTVVIACIDNFVMNMPTVEAKEVVRAHRIKARDGYIRCSNCNRRLSAVKSKFCQHCGAKMECIK